MSYPIIVSGTFGDKSLAESDFSANLDGSVVVFSGPDGSAARFAADGLSHFNVSLSDRPTVIAHYIDALDRPYCCVTCNGWQYCGETACCDIGGGNWLCC